ncbi:STAS/SEC14 domain-containing protein [Anabaena cylindrica UHCC 0172]|uniref:STAS/SEC14 domain-containing protein n=1 Tax=Anabaena cylindrica TaxID=1165 RepID=UPI002B213E6B|nr:STAS/SEC14 domain-containing protein [Anabaena cylindrica]MEA5549680.1 STAS/SEC14 domain-containing protein [Anabaena cylindrica UHCC 0172]
MPTVKVDAQLSALDLLQAAQQLTQPELEQFIEQILQIKAQRIAPSLSLKEFELLENIHQDLPQELQDLYQNLIGKRNQEILTESEYQQLLKLTEQVENHQAQRLEYLTQLAQIRQLPLTTLITQMGIKPINND